MGKRISTRKKIQIFWRGRKKKLVTQQFQFFFFFFFTGIDSCCQALSPSPRLGRTDGQSKNQNTPVVNNRVMQIQQENNQREKTKSNGMIDNRLSLIGRFFIQRFGTHNSWQTHQGQCLPAIPAVLYGVVAQTFLFSPEIFLFFPFLPKNFQHFFLLPTKREFVSQIKRAKWAIASPKQGYTQR